MTQAVIIPSSTEEWNMALGTTKGKEIMEILGRFGEISLRPASDRTLPLANNLLKVLGDTELIARTTLITVSLKQWQEGVARLAIPGLISQTEIWDWLTEVFLSSCDSTKFFGYSGGLRDHQAERLEEILGHLFPYEENPIFKSLVTNLSKEVRDDSFVEMIKDQANDIWPLFKLIEATIEENQEALALAEAVSALTIEGNYPWGFSNDNSQGKETFVIICA